MANYLVKMNRNIFCNLSESSPQLISKGAVPDPNSGKVRRKLWSNLPALLVKILCLTSGATLHQSSVAIATVDVSINRYLIEQDFDSRGQQQDGGAGAVVSVSGGIASGSAVVNSGTLRILIDTTDHMTGYDRTSERWYTSGAARAAMSGGFRVRKKTQEASNTIKLKFSINGSVVPPTYGRNVGSVAFSFSGLLHPTQLFGDFIDTKFTYGVTCSGQDSCSTFRSLGISGGYSTATDAMRINGEAEIPADVPFTFNASISASAAAGGSVQASNSAYFWLDLTDEHELISDGSGFLANARDPASAVPELSNSTFMLAGLLVIGNLVRIKLRRGQPCQHSTFGVETASAATGRQRAVADKISATKT